MWSTHTQNGLYSEVADIFFFNQEKVPSCVFKCENDTICLYDLIHALGGL